MNCKWNIIFLDIDWVLIKIPNEDNRREAIEKHWSVWVCNINLICERSVKLLKELVKESNSKIVLISSWRNYDTLLRLFYSKCEKLWFELREQIIWQTWTLWNRWKEIEQYLDKYKVDNFVIIDDDEFNISDNERLNKNYVKPVWIQWFSMKDKEKCLKILKNELEEEINEETINKNN